MIWPFNRKHSKEVDKIRRQAGAETSLVKTELATKMKHMQELMASTLRELEVDTKLLENNGLTTPTEGKGKDNG